MQNKSLLLIIATLLICCLLLGSCNIFFKEASPDVETAPNDQSFNETHKHSLVKIDEAAPSCEANGYKEHYTCTECKKIFADAEGSKEIVAPEKIEPTGHSWSTTVVENESGFVFKCINCDATKKADPIVSESYIASRDNGFISDKPYEMTLDYNSTTVTHSGASDRSDIGEGYIGGIDNVGEYVYYQFYMESAGTVDIIWTVAGNYYNSGSNLGLSDMANHLSVTIDARSVALNGIELPAVNGGSYEAMWWNFQQVVIKGVVLDEGIHTIKCDVISKGGVNIDDLAIHSTKPVSDELKVPYAEERTVDIVVEDGRVYYLLGYYAKNCKTSDFEFFNGNKIYPFTTIVDGNNFTFKIDLTDHATETFYPHLRLCGVNHDGDKGDVIIPSSVNYNKAYAVGCLKYQLHVKYDMPCVTVSVLHDYRPNVVVKPTFNSAGVGNSVCINCKEVDSEIGEITLPIISVDNGYEITEGVMTRYTYTQRVFTTIHTLLSFSFDFPVSVETEEYDFTASQLFGEIGSADGEYVDGYYKGEKDDVFGFVISSADKAVVGLSVINTEDKQLTYEDISFISVNGQESNVIALDGKMCLVLEKGTNRISFTLAGESRIKAISLSSPVEISSIKAEDTVGLMFMTYNIRLDADSGFKSWSSRKAALATHILGYTPDVICFQEVKKNQYNDLVTLIGDVYEIVWYGRDNTVSNPEGLAVAYKRTEFTEVSRTMFWLSETPEVQSMGWDAYAYLRIAVNVILQHKESGQMLNVFSVHLDSHHREACHKSLELVMSRAEAYDYPVYIAGDFNATDLSYAYHITDESYHDAKELSQESDFGSTVSGWQGGVDYASRAIDHIFVSPEHFIPTKYKACRDQWGEGYYHSDHFAVISEVLLITE